MNKTKKQNNEVSPPVFGQNLISNGISKILNTDYFQNLTNKFYKTNLVQNMSIATDIFLTGTFVNEVKKNKNIPSENKKPLIDNSIISTGLSIISTAVLNKLTDKPTEKLIKRYQELNPDIKNAQKQAQGIRAIKTVLIMGGVYYAVIPFISTLLSGKINNRQNKQVQKP